MWTNPWKFKEGFFIGGALILVGLALQLVAGPVVWETFSWPVNVVVFGVLLALIESMFLLRKKVYAFRFLCTYHAAVPALVYVVALTMVMGLTRQQSDGTWLHSMLTFWPFVLVYVYVALILGIIILNRLAHLQSWRRDVPFLLNHVGLFLALTTGSLGNGDMQRVKMITTIGGAEWRALTNDGAVKEMPLSIELKKFIMETYDDGSPKRFASEIHVTTKEGTTLDAVVDVNKPVEVDGWKIYQYGYDTQQGANSRMSILELVKDPWLPIVYCGIYMMLAGAVCMFVFGGRNRKTVVVNRMK